MKAMLLAAGRGERLRPLTDCVPKALVEVHRRSVLERHLEKLSAAGVKDVVINLGWLGEKIRQRIGSGSAYGLNVVYSDEGDNVLETGGGIHNALHLLGGEPFLVINADIHTDMPVPDVTLAENALGHLMLVPVPTYREAGDFDLVDGLVRNSQAPAVTYGGIAVYRPEFFDGCSAGRFSIVPMLRKAADEGRLQGSLYDGLWADIGTSERLLAANQT
ncbi:MAG: NTP transferase domain-containing protein [Gammaproteobacteria bacterium]|jgi:MurNAc alpha-1-phosphate uridylyltransferase|nr:NTP transferase domain-containing protein [Gammaproteobacteria bacterium]